MKVTMPDGIWDSSMTRITAGRIWGVESAARTPHPNLGIQCHTYLDLALDLLPRLPDRVQHRGRDGEVGGDRG
jgi:hypothetical protein